MIGRRRRLFNMFAIAWRAATAGRRAPHDDGCRSAEQRGAAVRTTRAAR
jgi:hypothetical protein